MKLRILILCIFLIADVYPVGHGAAVFSGMKARKNKGKKKHMSTGNHKCTGDCAKVKGVIFSPLKMAVGLLGFVVTSPGLISGLWNKKAKASDYTAIKSLGFFADGARNFVALDDKYCPDKKKHLRLLSLQTGTTQKQEISSRQLLTTDQSDRVKTVVKEVVGEMMKDAYEVLKNCHEYYVNTCKSYEEYAEEMNAEILDMTDYIPDEIAREITGDSQDEEVAPNEEKVPQGSADQEQEIILTKEERESPFFKMFMILSFKIAFRMRIEQFKAEIDALQLESSDAAIIKPQIEDKLQKFREILKLTNSDLKETSLDSIVGVEKHQAEIKL